MRFFNTGIIKIVWDRFTKAFKYLQQPTDWDKCWPLLMLTGQVMRHHNKWPRMCNYFLIADYKKCIFPSPKQSGWDIINVRNPERQCLLWHGVLISDNKELSLYSEIRLKVRLRMMAEGFKSILRPMLYSPPGSYLYTWHWLCVLAKSGLVLETWKHGIRNSPGFFLDSASSVRGLSQVFVSLVTTSHNFFSLLLINKLYSSQSIVKTCSISGIFQADVDNVGSDFDLNSLIEGDVDDDDFVSPREGEDASTPVVQTYYAPLKVRNFELLIVPSKNHHFNFILTFLMKHGVGGVEVYSLQMRVINITAREWQGQPSAHSSVFAAHDCDQNMILAWSWSAGRALYTCT